MQTYNIGNECYETTMNVQYVMYFCYRHSTSCKLLMIINIIIVVLLIEISQCNSTGCYGYQWPISYGNQLIINWAAVSSSKVRPFLIMQVRWVSLRQSETVLSVGLATDACRLLVAERQLWCKIVSYYANNRNSKWFFRHRQKNSNLHLSRREWHRNICLLMLYQRNS